MTLTYVYCIVRSDRRPSMSRVPPPVPGGEDVRALPAGDGIWLIVSHVAAADYSERRVAAGLQDIEWVGRRAMAHEAVVEHFLRAPALLPMQLFTLFLSDERAVADVTARRRRITRVLDAVARKAEWGVRLTLGAATPVVASRRGASSSRETRQTVSGAAYLSHKRELLATSRERASRAQAAADRAYRALSRAAAAARRMTSKEQAAAGSRLLVDAAFLVPSSGAAAFRRVVRETARSMTAAGVELTMTGPWPPYNFIDPKARGTP